MGPIDDEADRWTFTPDTSGGPTAFASGAFTPLPGGGMWFIPREPSDPFVTVNLEMEGGGTTTIHATPAVMFSPQPPAPRGTVYRYELHLRAVAVAMEVDGLIEGETAELEDGATLRLLLRRRATIMAMGPGDPPRHPPTHENCNHAGRLMPVGEHRSSAARYRHRGRHE